MKHLSRRTLYASALLVALAVPVTQANDDRRITPPAVPTDLQVTGPNRPYLAGHAYGSQNYVCVTSASGVAWALYTPQATLFDDDNDQIITHFLSANPAEDGTPRATWQDSRDTSAAWAVAVATSSDAAFVRAGAVPWLKLQVLATKYGPGWGGRLTKTTFIQRVNTVGGIAPADGCAAIADIGKKAFVPYSADYVFYRRR